MAKLTDRELNAKLMESLNITTAEAKRAFEQLMKDKVEEIRKKFVKKYLKNFQNKQKLIKKILLNLLIQL